MPESEYCTCGAKLPEDALFCHKCGKPQVELPEVEPPTPVEPEAPVLPPPPPPEVGFGNRQAVRSGLLAAVLGSVVVFFLNPLPAGVNVVWMVVGLVAAGFFSVWLYERRTGSELSATQGARVGWMTGVFCFAFATTLLTVAYWFISTDEEALGELRDRFGQQAPPNVDPEEVISLLMSPMGVLAILLFLGFLFTVLPTLGGAMGAKVLEKE
ncbi:MAG: zinc ribbon domain-containing protein [bacterium]|nr:zinc ribbon domain-containing protein [bacterium]